MCYLLVTGTFSCVLKVSDRFSEYKENPENTGFSGSVALLGIQSFLGSLLFRVFRSGSSVGSFSRVWF